MTTSPNIKQIVSLIQFSQGDNAVWTGLTVPVAAGIVTFSLDDGVFKLGDGSTMYADLPVLFTYAQLLSAQGNLNIIFDTPVNQNGNIVVVGTDGSNYKYSVSSTTLVSLLSALTTLGSLVSGQTVAIAPILAAAVSIGPTIGTGTNGDVITIIGGQYSDSGETVASIQDQISSGATYTPGSHIMEVTWYSDSGMTTVADKANLTDGSTYYLKVPAFNDATSVPVVNMTSTNPNVEISKISTGTFNTVFMIILNNITNNQEGRPIILTITCDDGSGYSVIKKSIVGNVY